MKIQPLATAPDNPPYQGLPLFSCRVRAGFPSAADDFMDRPLDLNEFCVRHPSATYFVKAEGDSMIDIGIHDDDLLIVDRSEHQTHGCVVIVAIDGDLTCKILDTKRKRLLPANKDYSPILISDRDDVVIEGVVRYSIQCYLK